MKHDPLFSSTARAPTTGTLAQVKEYWRETWPNAMDARMQPRRSTAEEIFPHLARAPSPRTGNPTSGSVTSSARAPHSPARAEAFPAPTSARPAVEGSRAVGSRLPVLHAAGGSFISEREAQRGAISPLEALFPGGVAK
jgi:hypothetical protein